MKNLNPILTERQLQSEIEKCEYCEKKPCREACPAHCSPADFLMAAKGGLPSDYKRAALMILEYNPLGGVCGSLCPDYHCMRACVYKKYNSSVQIPKTQATIIAKAHKLGVLKKLPLVKSQSNGKKIAIMGAGPTGLAACAYLARKGFKIDLYDVQKKPGGSCNLIPELRLSSETLKHDINYLLSFGDISFFGDKQIESPKDLTGNSYDAVLVSSGLGDPIKLGVSGEDLTISWKSFLENPQVFKTNGRVAVLGGGATAVDCALLAKTLGASDVDIFVLETLDEMPITNHELELLINNKIRINNRLKITDVKNIGGLKTLEVIKVTLGFAGAFDIKALSEIKGTEHKRNGFDQVIVAIGNRRVSQQCSEENVFYAGDYMNGPTTVVEAVAAGKNIAKEIDSYCFKKQKEKVKNPRNSYFGIDGFEHAPVSLKTDFFGRTINGPFLLSASPMSDGFEQMKKAYEAGWPGGVMKTVFDGVSIHIPAEYMFTFGKNTYGNCDNVSGHSLNRVCGEVRELVKLYPDRLTIASTGGPISGNDEADKKVWQSNTSKLEKAGAMGIEYSLSCPQGGDGTEGDIVSQNAALSAKIIDWVLEKSNKDVPKLFKLTAAVTSPYPIMKAIGDVFEKHKGHKAGVTLANTFPAMAFRDSAAAANSNKSWDEGVIVGLSGEGVTPISYLTLANVSRFNIPVSGNAGPMNYMAAANFLALGARSVQFCTIVTKYGYGIINELNSGLSYLLESKGMKTVGELIGSALPKPVTDFMELSPVKKISACDEEVCLECGNCTRCPYMAIKLNDKNHPVTDPEKCIGCSICAKKCFSGALFMRERTSSELKALKED